MCAASEILRQVPFESPFSWLRIRFAYAINGSNFDAFPVANSSILTLRWEKFIFFLFSEIELWSPYSHFHGFLRWSRTKCSDTTGKPYDTHVAESIKIGKRMQYAWSIHCMLCDDVIEILEKLKVNWSVARKMKINVVVVVAEPMDRVKEVEKLLKSFENINFQRCQYSFPLPWSHDCLAMCTQTHLVAVKEKLSYVCLSDYLQA